MVTFLHGLHTLLFLVVYIIRIVYIAYMYCVVYIAYVVLIFSYNNPMDYYRRPEEADDYELIRLT